MSDGRRRGDPHRMLLRALAERAGAGNPPAIGPSRSDAWASATFRGERHAITLRFSGADAGTRAGRLADGMDEMEFHLAGHIVADITILAREQDGDEVALSIEALTVEDA